jgi:dTDP-4-dehydrorhamnose reductase
VSASATTTPARWLVTGAAGLLGGELVTAIARLRPADAVTPTDLARLDIRDPADVALAVAGQDVVVNCAGWTDVDAAEEHEAEAFALNAGAVRILAQACSASGARLIHVSTDYVFDGGSRVPYAEDSAPAPTGAYGRSKLAGERAVAEELRDRGIVVRTAWLYGVRGRSFVRTMIDRARRGEPAAVVNDQRGQPTWNRVVAERIVLLGSTAGTSGIYHATCRGEATWLDVAREVYRRTGADPSLVRPITSGQLGRLARRPAYSVLADLRGPSAGLPALPDWRVALARALAEMDPSGEATSEE